MYWSYSFDYDWLISPDSEWLKSPDANRTKTNPSLFYTTQKEESLVQPHNIINDCICNIS